MSVWPFEPYQKIPESPRAWHLEEKAHRRLSRETFVVTEKIHGANFRLATDGKEVRCANRRHWLAEDESFFAWQGLRDRLQDAVLAVAKEFKGGRVHIIGEQFGGAYPHPGVPAVPGVQAVQTGIWYAPGIEFCAFDVAIENNDTFTYLDFELARQVCTEAGLLFSTPLFIGSLNDATEYPIDFTTHVPARLGLPPLSEPNPAEGVVIKPLRAVTVETPEGMMRPVLKRKIPAFAEDERFAGAEKWTTSAETSRLDLLRWEVVARLNEARVNAAVSKIGLRTSPRDKSRGDLLFRLVVDEVIAEITAAQSESGTPLTDQERESLAGYTGKETRNLLWRMFSGKERRV